MPKPPPRLYAESACQDATCFKQGRLAGAQTREPGDLPNSNETWPSGVTEKEEKMSTNTSVVQSTDTSWLPLVLAALLGLGIIFVTGHLQAATIHDAAHDVRHATGFPCH